MKQSTLCHGSLHKAVVESQPRTFNLIFFILWLSVIIGHCFVFWLEIVLLGVRM